jgi:hypothetical protein
MHSRGARDAPGIFCRIDIGRGRANPWMTSSVISWLITSVCFEVDLWFPRERRYSLSIVLDESSIGCRGKAAPFFQDVLEFEPMWVIFQYLA